MVNLPATCRATDNTHMFNPYEMTAILLATEMLKYGLINYLKGKKVNMFEIYFNPTPPD